MGVNRKLSVTEKRNFHSLQRVNKSSDSSLNCSDRGKKNYTNRLLLKEEMASQRERFGCSICLGLLKDPVTATCGHSYCKICIKTYWDAQEKMGTCSCPQCRKTFKRRPVLGINTMLADVVGELRKKGHEAAPAIKRVKRERELEVNRPDIQQRSQDKEKKVKPLQQELEAINNSADEVVEHSERVFSELFRLMEKRRSDLEQQVRSRQQTEVSRVKELQRKLEQGSPSSSGLSGSADSSITNNPSLRYFKGLTADVTNFRDILQDVLREEWTEFSQTVTGAKALLSQPQPEPEPQTRADFLKYSCDITLDPNTANEWLSLSEGNRIVTFPKRVHYPGHPDRFMDDYQVLSKESLTGRCYWEVRWKGEAGVAVSYKNIRRTGDKEKSRFGHDKSCMLYCDNDSYTFCMDNIKVAVSGPWSPRIGVYLDHSAGILSFYSVSETMTLLYTITLTFAQPLYAGLGFNNSTRSMFTAGICKLKQSEMISEMVG